MTEFHTAPLHKETPLWRSRPLSRLHNQEVFLKMEALQEVGSFKIRGIGHLCQQYANEGKTTLISSSGGNAGLAAAYSAETLGLKAKVFVPHTTPGFMIEKIQAYGAEVTVHGAAWDEAHQKAEEYLGTIPHEGAMIHPFDHPRIWEGHQTIINEIADQLGKPSAIICSVGGGGLLLGILKGLQNLGWSDVEVHAVETIGADSLHQSLQENQRVTLDRITSKASSLGAKTVAKEAFELSRTMEVSSHLVTDSQAYEGCLLLAKDHRILTELACGASIASLFSNSFNPPPGPIVTIVCGGAAAALPLSTQNGDQHHD